LALAVLGGLVAVIGGYVAALKESDWLYKRSIAARLGEVFGDPEVLERAIDLDEEHEPIVILSDQHKGTRDGADDFWRAERAYCAALGWYYERGYRLIVLGDAEELWETLSPRKVIEHHDEAGMALMLESMFHAAGRYDRVWGNHDLLWRSRGAVDRYLGTGRPGRPGPFGAGFAVREALKIRLNRNGQRQGVAFLVHGHQGTADSEVITRISRPAVWLFGILQRRHKRGWNTPATNFGLRTRHDSAMEDWALSRTRDGVILIAGHTHRPVFWDIKPSAPTDARIAELEAELDAAREANAGQDELAERRAALEFARAAKLWRSDGEPPPEDLQRPVYFNTGCCSFADGDITGIEIVRGRIRLVRWPDECGRLRPMVLGDSDVGLPTVLSAVKTGVPDTAPAPVEPVEPAGSA
jgi:hypothetical protein